MKQLISCPDMTLKEFGGIIYLLCCGIAFNVAGVLIFIHLYRAP